MGLIAYNQNPTVRDTILFDLYTTDESGNQSDPYKVDRVTIFFVERNYVTDQYYQITQFVAGSNTQFTYSDAIPFKVYGSDDYPAWLSSDTPNAVIERIPYDVDGMPEVGHFQLQWTPELAREGDYFLCYAWTPVPAGNTLSKSFYFFLTADSHPAAPPRHLTKPGKYEVLLDRYLPEMFKLQLGQGDLTPDVLARFSSAVAKGFTDLEDLANQLIDLQDANVVKDTLLPYIANFFRWKLRSNDSILWRRQCRRAIPLYKKKGTIGGLREALDQCGIQFKKLTHYWQVASKATWQEGIVYTGDCTLQLAKRAKLPEDSYNFVVSYRRQSSANYVEVSSANYVFVDHSTATDDCPTSNEYYTTLVLDSDICDLLEVGDIVKVLYKVAEPEDQNIETYIQSLPLSDNRDEMTVTYPVKNWNVRLIAEDDALIDVVCPAKHAFQYPVIWGKRRTEFPYSENIYNMDEYNGSTSDSEEPCHIDASFYDICSGCRSSQVSLDVLIEKMSNDRIQEAEEVIKDFLPFHSPLHTINYVGLVDELIPPPEELIECLIHCDLYDNVIVSQFDFNRIIEDGLSDADELKRNMLANTSTVATGSDGNGFNLRVMLSAPGYDFDDLGIGTTNLLEIQAGPHLGEYSLAAGGEVIGLTDFPLSSSGFGFRFSNQLFTESGASIYQENQSTFTATEILLDYPIVDGGTWSIRVNAGIYAGTYPISIVQSNNSLMISGWTAGFVTGLNYDLLTPGSMVAESGTAGQVDVRFVGRLVTSPIVNEWNVKQDDYIKIGSNQYSIISAVSGGATDNLYLDGWSGGNVVGSVNYQALKRVVNTGYGTLAFNGMKLTTTINYESTLGIQNGANPPMNVVESSDFKENYLVVIDSVYYQMSNIDGNDIYLFGPVIDWGLAGTTGISYSLINFTKIPVTTQDGTDFQLIDRRTDGVIEVNQAHDPIPVSFRMQMLNRLNNGEAVDEVVHAKEVIWCTVERR
jgi:hypothetical protein